ncbi:MULTISPECIES: hypothetical protein [unclassified Geodermatophilus]|uniref:hypothetical protein n=1 Tax=unclassified Geodermatophilus TaxID=2637632 RepID=UPI003EED5A26
MHTRTPAPPGCATAAGGRVAQPAGPARHAVTGGGLLALAMSRRARGLRGLDVLRPSQDRAPPGVR